MDIVSNLIAGLSLIVSGVAVLIARKANKNALRLTEENTRLANGNIELEIRNMISESRRYLSEVSTSYSPILDKFNSGKLPPDEISHKEALERQYSDSKQDYINSYEEACAKYIDAKIDKKRFKKSYQVEIRNIVESPDLKNIFDSHSSRYRAIKIVYDEWENLEKQI